MKRKLISQKGMSAARWDKSVLDSIIKREGKNAYPTVYPCGCSSPDCTWPITKDVECSINKPLLICIPQGGIDIDCPVHGKHRIYGPKVSL